MDPIEHVIDDLGRRVAQSAIEASEWRARALVAEEALAEIRADLEAEEDTDG